MNVLFCFKVHYSQILSRAFKLKDFDFSVRFLYMVWIKSYLYVNSNVKISDQSGMKQNQIVMIAHVSVDKISAPPH